MLSKDIIPKLIKNQTTRLENTILQIIDLKIMHQENVLVVLSDEINQIEGSLNSSFIPSIQSGAIALNQLIKLLDYTVIVTEGRPSINILDLEALGVVLKRGNPQPLKRISLTANYTPISALSTFLYDWTLRAKVGKKSELAEFQNKKTLKNDKYMTLRLSDCQGSQISASFFGEAAEKFFNVVKEGSIYLFSNGNVNLADSRYRTSDCNYQLHFNANADIRLDDDQSFEMKVIERGITPLIKLRDLRPKSLVDVLGVVVEVGQLTEKVSKLKGETLTQRILKIVDESGMSIELSLWNELANSPEMQRLVPNNSVIHAKSVNITVFNETLCLSSVKALTEISFDPTTEEARRLLGWFKGADSNSLLITDLSIRKEGSKETPDFKTIIQIKNEQPGNERHFVVGRVQFAKSDDRKLTYESCVKCKKKVEMNGEGVFHCLACSSFGKECVHKYLVRGMIVGDFSGSIYCTAFNETAEMLFKLKASEFARKSEAEQEEIVKSVGSGQYLFTVKANLVNRNDGSTRTEYTVGYAQHINFGECTKRILDMVNRQKTS